MSPFDVSSLTEDELLDLNRRMVERLRLIRSARHLVALADLSVGMRVEFTTSDGRVLCGTIARLNQQTATVTTASGSWRVSPSFLRTAEWSDEVSRQHRVVGLPLRRSRP